MNDLIEEGNSSKDFASFYLQHAPNQSCRCDEGDEG